MDTTPASYHDSRLALYRALLTLLLLLASGLIIKVFFLDTAIINNTHMQPSLQSGDRILYHRLSAIPPLNWIFRPSRGSRAVFSMPAAEDSYACLRIGALSGDSISISHGVFINHTAPLPSDRGFSIDSSGAVLPEEYSPRDFMKGFRIPRPGNVIVLDTLNYRDFIFCSLMRMQEFPARSHKIQADLFIDGVENNETVIENFTLYRGAFSSIPDSLRSSWFFWERLYDYFNISYKDNGISLQLALLENGENVFSYKVKKDFVFYIADSWIDGYDSRYFGPVCSDNLLGIPAAILWSITPGSTFFTGMRMDRIGRFL